jgi:hypothetical protein
MRFSKPSLATTAMSLLALASAAPAVGSSADPGGVESRAEDCQAGAARSQGTGLRKSIDRTARELRAIRTALDRLQSSRSLPPAARDDYYGLVQSFSRALRALRIDSALFTQPMPSCARAQRAAAAMLASLDRSELAIQALRAEMIRGTVAAKSVALALEAAADGVAALQGTQATLLGGAERAAHSARSTSDPAALEAATSQ